MRGFEKLRQDVLHAVRVFRRRPVPTLLVVASLGLGIGVGTAIFSIVNAIILRPLPYTDSGRLVMLWPANPKEGITEDQARSEGRSMSGAEFLDWQEKSGVFERMVAFGSNETTVTQPGDPVMIFGYSPTPGLFPLLGVTPSIGRGFLPEEERPGGPEAVVLRHDLWQRRFGGDPSVIGKKLVLTDTAYTIVGVMPPEFVFFSRQVEFLSPLRWPADNMRRSRGYRSLRVMARLKPGYTLEQSQARADVFSDNLARDYPATNHGLKMRLVPVNEDATSSIRSALLMLMGGVGCVLLITCLNVANLILVQVASRGRELAARSAMGASRGRLIQQLLTENLLLSAAGGACGLALAWILIQRFQALLPDPMTYGKWLIQVEGIRMDSRVVGFALLVALITGVVFGLIPALRASRPDLNELLKDAGRGSAGGRSTRKLQEALVVAEVSLALVMVTGAVLLVRSFVGLYSRGPGIRTENVLTFQSQLPWWEMEPRLRKQGLSGDALGKAADVEMRSLNERILERVQALPGVRSAGLTSYIPMTGWYRRTDVTIEGRAVDPAAKGLPQALVRIVSPGYFETIGLPLVRGRQLEARDGPDSMPVVVIDQEMARRYWAGDNPLGKRMKWGGPGGNDPWLTVVGVMGDIREDGIDKPPQPTFYVPLKQGSLFGFFLAVRTQSEPTSILPALRRALSEAHPQLPIYRVRKLEDIVLDSTWRLRYSMLLLGGLSALALILAVIGVYGVLSYAISTRTQEIGVRMALGADQDDIVRLVMSRGVRLMAIGVVIGLAAAGALTRSLSTLLFGVSALDPLTFALVAVVLVGAGCLACYVPSLRASRLNPVTALRHE